MGNKLATIGIVEAVTQGILWLAATILFIKELNLENIWWLICTISLVLEVSFAYTHSRVTLPELIRYLGYKPNEKLSEVASFKIYDHLFTIFVTYLIVYNAVKT